MKVNINDEATVESISTTEGKTAVDELITALGSQAALKALAWSPALQNAGKDWIDAVLNEDAPTATINGSTTASRAAKYGDIATGGKDVYQAIVAKFNFNALNAVIYLLVDDGKKA
jgi:hypothetical protein